MNKLLLIMLIVFFYTEIFGQYIITKEKTEKNNYVVELQIKPNFEIVQKNGINRISFNYIDESAPNQLSIPSFDILIPVPINSKPSILAFAEKTSVIKAIPFLNPEIEAVGDSFIVYKEPNEHLTTFFDFQLVKNLGFLINNNNYYLHCKVSPFEFRNNEIFFNEKINLVLTFNQGFNNSINSEYIGGDLFFKKNGQSELQTTVKESPINWWVDGQNYLKMGVSNDAIYRITYNELIDNGFNIQGINPKYFQLFLKGEEIPIVVYGEEDEVFNNTDYIEFTGFRNYGTNYREKSLYNQPYNEYLDRYSDTTIYWLTNGQTLGKRHVEQNLTQPSEFTNIYHFNKLIHKETNSWFDFSIDSQIRRELPFWTENKTWIYNTRGVGTTNETFVLPDVYANDTAYAYVKIMSYAANISQNAHKVGISVNSDPAVYDSVFFNKYEQRIIKAKFNSNILLSGNNKLYYTSYPTNATLNSFKFDWSEIEYPKKLNAISDSLSFIFLHANKNICYKINISNVQLSNNKLYKYNKSNNDLSLITYFRNSDTLYYYDTLKADNYYFLYKTDDFYTPKYYYTKSSFALKSSNNSAQYILITHPIYINTANEYANLISSSYNIYAKIININDIYDEFNYGFFAPEPIKDFLQFAYSNWSGQKINYVFLVGRATYDYYNNRSRAGGGPRVFNTVPSYGASVSDSWYVIWDSTGANIPQLNIGRLPVRSNEEFISYMNKHQNYIQNGFTEWNKKYLFFSGGNFADPNQINTLKSINDEIINSFVQPRPIGGDATHFYKTANPITNFGPYTPGYVQDKIDEGSVFISYLGHSGTQTWDNSITDPIQLRNLVNRSPLITDFGCSTARFAEPDITSFSELFVSGLSGQAIGYIGNSSLGFTSTSYTAPKLFYSKILRDSVYTLGEAHRLAKLEMLSTYGSTGTYQLFALTNTLVGDPIVNIAIPPKPNLEISLSNIVLNSNINDMTDSTECKISYFNIGKALSDSFNITVNHIYNSQLIDSKHYRIILPIYVDSIEQVIAINGNVGEHKIEVLLDSDNEINEINEDDNSILYSFNVYSSSIRNLNTSLVENQIFQKLKLINPIVKPNIEKIQVKISKNKDFSFTDSLDIPFGSLVTEINLSEYSSIDRLWIKSKLEGVSEYGTPISFYLGEKDKFLLKDSLSFYLGNFYNLQYSINSVMMDTTFTNLYVLSAGYNAGKTVIVALNNQNLIPENTLRGYHVCRFEKDNLSLIEYKLFDISGGGSYVTNFINYLDAVGDDEIIAIAVSDDGQVGLNVALKNKIKEFGSKYIDQLAFRGSWALIGYRGAPIGSVPEGLKTAFAGKVEIDTTILRMPSSGTYTTSEIGPAAKWRDFEVMQSVSEGAEIKYRVLGITDSNTVDSLDYIPVNEVGFGDINHINADKYPKIKLHSEFSILPNAESPSLKSLSVNFVKIPELAINYQVVSVSSDSIDQGQELNFSFAFMNVGGSPADSFRVLVNFIKPDNSKRVIIDSLVSRLDTMVFQNHRYTYRSNFEDGFGSMAFEVILDTENKVRELYKDNNYFKIPFYIIKDTVTNLHSAKINAKFDDIDIADGDFVAAKPVISMELDYFPLFPYSDTTAIRFYLDGSRVFHSQIDSTVFDTVSRKVVFYLKPILADGEHFIRITGNNLIGNLEGTTGYQKYFTVSSEAKILYAYNYPNPFAEHTFFTFKLTQIPDELSIKVYTVAGRLIKVIDLNPADLSIDFNKVYWDGKDQDGDDIANGVYFYKIYIKSGDKQESITQKLAKVK